MNRNLDGPATGPALGGLPPQGPHQAIARRLDEAAEFFASRFFDDDTTVGLTITRSVHPDETGLSALYPLLSQGYVDWTVLTGENLRLDTLARPLDRADPQVARVAVGLPEIVRVLDQLLPKAALLDLDEFIRRLIESPPFQRICSSAELHYLLGKFLAERERLLQLTEPCLLSVAYRYGVPVYTPFAGESLAGTHAAAAALTGNRLVVDAIQDLNETAAILYAAKNKGRSAILSLGGGTPENFALQSAAHLASPLGFGDFSHDVLLRIKQPRPGEPAREPGPIPDMQQLHPDMQSLIVFTDTAVALPLLALTALQRVPPRPCKRMIEHREDLLENLRQAYLRHSLERQQQEIQERVRRTVLTLQERVVETHGHIQQRVHETQTQIQSKVSETRGAIQSEVTRLQRQFAQQMQRIVAGVRTGKTDLEETAEPQEPVSLTAPPEPENSDSPRPRLDGK